MTEHDSLRAPLEREFGVHVKEGAGRAVVTVSGELDVASSQALEREFAKLDDVPLVVVDVRDLTFIDSTGLGVLVKAHQAAREHGRRFGLVRAEGQVGRLLILTGLAEELLGSE